MERAKAKDRKVGYLVRRHMSHSCIPMVNEVKIRVKVQLRMLAKDWAQDLFTVQRIHLDDSNSVFFRVRKSNAGMKEKHRADL
jgi:hypothetical protein